MKNNLYCTALLFFIAIASACANTSPPVNLSISGKINLPIITSQKKYWIDTGPLFVLSRDPLISYRVINKDEIEFSGSKKNVYDFFHSVYASPNGDSEISLAESYKSYKKSHQAIEGLDFHTYTGNGEIKTYITSKELAIGVEVYISGEENSHILSTIIKHANLTQGK